MRHDRINQHVDKGNDDNLYISSVACNQELWALIMDAGTGFTAQVKEYSPNQFLPKDWIVEQARTHPKILCPEILPKIRFGMLGPAPPGADAAPPPRHSGRRGTTSPAWQAAHRPPAWW